MTEQHLIEKILKKFPDRGESEIRLELNVVQKEFCRETELIEGEFTTFNLDGTSLYFAMGTDVVAIKQVDVNGAKIDPLHGIFEIDLQT